MIEYDNVVRSIAYDQHEILYNIMQMHNGGKPFECDMTYSKGAFYGDFNITDIAGERRTVSIPRPGITFDVAPQDEETAKIEPDGPLPLEDGSIGSIVVDLPFVISVGKSMKQDPRHDPETFKKGSNIITNRFSGYYPRWEMYKSYDHWLHEAYRVLQPGGILVWKNQNVISGSTYIATEEFSWFDATRIGFYTLDRFILLAKARLISGKVKKQMHARNFSSSFWVFQKTGHGTKKIEDYFVWMEDGNEKETLNKILNGGKKPQT